MTVCLLAIALIAAPAAAQNEPTTVASSQVDPITGVFLGTGLTLTSLTGMTTFAVLFRDPSAHTSVEQAAAAIAGYALSTVLATVGAVLAVSSARGGPVPSRDPAWQWIGGLLSLLGGVLLPLSLATAADSDIGPDTGVLLAVGIASMFGSLTYGIGL